MTPAQCACSECEAPIPAGTDLCAGCDEAGCDPFRGRVMCRTYDEAALTVGEVASWWTARRAPAPPPLDSTAPALAARRALRDALMAAGKRDPVAQDDWCRAWLRHRDLPCGPAWGLGALTADQAAAAALDAARPRPTGTEHTGGDTCWCPACVQRRMAARRAPTLRHGEAD